MPRHIDPPKTLKERYGTFKNYLKETAEQHNGFKYRDFLLLINPKRKHKISVAGAAETFNVSSTTWYAWLKWYREEQATLPQSEAAGAPADPA